MFTNIWRFPSGRSPTRNGTAAVAPTRGPSRRWAPLSAHDHDSQRTQAGIRLADDGHRVSRAVTPHMLRASAATHLFDAGVAQRQIQWCCSATTTRPPRSTTTAASAPTTQASPTSSPTASTGRPSRPKPPILIRQAIGPRSTPVPATLRDVSPFLDYPLSAVSPTRHFGWQPCDGPQSRWSLGLLPCGDSSYGSPGLVRYRRIGAGAVQSSVKNRG